MAASLDTPSPASKQPSSSFMASSSPLFSPSSDNRFWSSLRTRIDALLEDGNSKIPIAPNLPNADPSMPNEIRKKNVGESRRPRASGEDSLLLMRGFDSIAQTLSQLSNTLENALQAANDLAKPPRLTEIFQKSEHKEKNLEDQKNAEDPHVGFKRKFDNSHCSEEENEEELKDGKLKKAKNLAISMATKAASFSRELKSIRSDLCFMQERCGLLEEENRRLRDGLDKGLRPEEDDLVRLQLEALLAEKSRLANENANLVRENQCLNQLVEYHQLTSHDMSASYEQVLQGLCLDFSSPPRPIAEEEENEGEDPDNQYSRTTQTSLFDFSATPNDEHETTRDR